MRQNLWVMFTYEAKTPKTNYLPIILQITIEYNYNYSCNIILPISVSCLLSVNDIFMSYT